MLMARTRCALHECAQVAGFLSLFLLLLNQHSDGVLGHTHNKAFTAFLDLNLNFESIAFELLDSE
jgi:hypothetical protein